jgi:hypothetical protein
VIVTRGAFLARFAVAAASGILIVQLPALARSGGGARGDVDYR